jgi:hypothetical protein
VCVRAITLCAQVLSAADFSAYMNFHNRKVCAQTVNTLTCILDESRCVSLVLCRRVPTHTCYQVFLPQYAPQPFVYAVRRADMCPEGVLSIEADLVRARVRD